MTAATPQSGAIMIVVTALVFGVMPTLASVAYDSGASATMFQAGRFGCAMVALWAFHLWRRRSFPRGLNMRRAGWVAAMAALTAGVSFGYIGAVQWLPVQQATLTFFTFPLLVGLACHCFGVEKMSRLGAVCLLAGFGGLALVVGEGEGGETGGEWIGYGMAFGASLLVTASFFVLRAARRDIAGMELTLWVLAWCVGIFFGALALGAPSGVPETGKGWLAVLTAGMTYGIGLACLYEGIARIGPLWTAALINLEPVISLLAAWSVLGERMTPTQLAGAALVLAAIIGIKKARRLGEAPHD